MTAGARSWSPPIRISATGAVIRSLGGITPYLIRLTVCKTGSNFGFLEKVICIHGYSGAGAVVASNVDKTSVGSAIGVSIDTSNNAYSQIIMAAHSDAMSIVLDVVSPGSDRNHILMFP